MFRTWHILSWIILDHVCIWCRKTTLILKLIHIVRTSVLTNDYNAHYCRAGETYVSDSLDVLQIWKRWSQKSIITKWYNEIYLYFSKCFLSLALSCKNQNHDLCHHLVKWRQRCVTSGTFFYTISYNSINIFSSCHIFV